jgi:hypothetical protein
MKRSLSASKASGRRLMLKTALQGTSVLDYKQRLGATLISCAYCSYLTACLEQRDGANVVTLRVLLILKNCLRCQYVNAVDVSRWLVENGKLSRAIKNLSLGRQQRSSPSEQQQQRTAATVQDQIIKTASDIIRISHAK